MRYIKGDKQDRGVVCANGQSRRRRLHPNKGSAPSRTGDFYVAALPIEQIRTVGESPSMLESRPDARQLARARRKCGVDERHTILFAPGSADRARARNSHRHRMGSDQHLSAPVLAHDVASELPRQRGSWRPLGRCFRLGQPGSHGRAAIKCSREEVVREVWAQLKRSINCRARNSARRGSALMVSGPRHRQRSR